MNESVRSPVCVLALLIAALLATGGCDRIVCERRTISTIVSPDQTQTASVVHMMCGATVPNRTIVYLQGRPHWYDIGDGQQVVVLMNTHEPVLSWPDRETLDIAVSEDAYKDIWERKARVGSVGTRFSVKSHAKDE
jgi:hypothetical protein